ncbi:hypothetical protein ARMSODRAFT_979428 [Armillaria solidipes]|uniref:Uncharacterized protein n=1 Tax=Armillaria solidipes TaxID=1076256 RepID=A0A2H3BDE1_9AGAR|nr:hypothetical protein ARMSODRAFT_979428 [Armillaria solidipes]
MSTEVRINIEAGILQNKDRYATPPVPSPQTRPKAAYPDKSNLPSGHVHQESRLARGKSKGHNEQVVWRKRQWMESKPRESSSNVWAAIILDPARDVLNSNSLDRLEPIFEDNSGAMGLKDNTDATLAQLEHANHPNTKMRRATPTILGISFVRSVEAAASIVTYLRQPIRRHIDRRQHLLKMQGTDISAGCACLIVSQGKGAIVLVLMNNPIR